MSTLKLHFIIYLLRLLVILKTPEGKRSKPEQVKTQLISVWKTEPVTVAIVSDDLGFGVKG